MKMLCKLLPYYHEGICPIALGEVLKSLSVDKSEKPKDLKDSFYWCVDY